MEGRSQRPGRMVDTSGDESGVGLVAPEIGGVGVEAAERWDHAALARAGQIGGADAERPVVEQRRGRRGRRAERCARPASPRRE
ncbi:MAG: hypothetical protein R2705_23990 [Ilumatobacteraceae bacterium]